MLNYLCVEQQKKSIFRTKHFLLDSGWNKHTHTQFNIQNRELILQRELPFSILCFFSTLFKKKYLKPNSTKEEVLEKVEYTIFFIYQKKIIDKENHFKVFRTISNHLGINLWIDFLYSSKFFFV